MCLELQCSSPVGSSPCIACSGPPLIVHNDPERSGIIHLSHRNLLADHLLVDAVDALQTALHATITCLNMHNML